MECGYTAIVTWLCLKYSGVSSSLLLADWDGSGLAYRRYIVKYSRLLLLRFQPLDTWALSLERRFVYFRAGLLSSQKSTTSCATAKASLTFYGLIDSNRFLPYWTALVILCALYQYLKFPFWLTKQVWRDSLSLDSSCMVFTSLACKCPRGEYPVFLEYQIFLPPV